MRNSSALALVLSSALIFSIGLLMVFNTTAAEILDRSLDTNLHAALLKQLGFACIGLLFGILSMKLGYEKLLQWSVPLLVMATILLASLFVPGVAQTVNGARRWLSLFGFSFQPSEGAKVLIPAAYIHWFLKRDADIDFKSFCKVLSLLAIPIALILLEPDNGTTAIIMCLLGFLFFLTRIRWKYWALPIFTLIGAAGLVAYHMPHVQDRIRVYLHPELDLRGKGHQPHQAKIAAGSGGLLGRGLGESLQKLNYLPEARSDYIAAIYAEETGFIGMVFLIGLYTAFTYAGFSVALQTKDKGAFLLSSVLTFLIAIQAFLNLGIVSGLLPSKGMTLPFFSQGGSSLMVNIVILFLLLDMARKKGNDSLSVVGRRFMQTQSGRKG